MKPSQAVAREIQRTMKTVNMKTVNDAFMQSEYATAIKPGVVSTVRSLGLPAQKQEIRWKEIDRETGKATVSY